jgi:RecJ-like exonuclease
MNGRNVAGFEAAAAAAAAALLRARSVTVVAHIDADGITAASIASAALSRAGIEHGVRFVKKIDDAEIQLVAEDPADLVWLVDLGSGSFSRLDPAKVVVSDHHRTDATVGHGQADLFSFGAEHVNPQLFGMDGSLEISGAGATYAVAKAMSFDNRDLAALALVGAVGDFQDNAAGRLVGYNRNILQDAIDSGRARAIVDLRLFGRETRPLPAFIMYSTDPALLPVLRATLQASFRRADEIGGSDWELVSSFLSELGIERYGEGWGSWASLRPDERRCVASELCERLLDAGRGTAPIRRLIGEVYALDPRLVNAPDDWLKDRDSLPGDDEGEWRPNARALLDAKEMATLLNACGRHGRPETGMAICLGDRYEALTEALRLQVDHRAALREAISLVQCGGEFGIIERDDMPCLRYFHGGDRIEDTIVGIVAGMLLGDAAPADRPLFGLVSATDGTATIKVSARGTRALVERGLDLSAVMRQAAEAVRGSGGGHNIAAGASIPQGTEDDFLCLADKIMRGQLSR